MRFAASAQIQGAIPSNSARHLDSDTRKLSRTALLKLLSSSLSSFRLRTQNAMSSLGILTMEKAACQVLIIPNGEIEKGSGEDKDMKNV